MDLNPKPKWAVVFGGQSYTLVLFNYVTDSSNKIRPALFCTEINQIDDRKFPICSVVIYMALAATMSQEDLFSRLKITVPGLPEPVLTRRLSQHLAATAAQVLKVGVHQQRVTIGLTCVV